MNIRMETARTKQIGGAILAWLLTALLLLLLAALLIGGMKQGGRWIRIASAAVVFLSSAAACAVFLRGKKTEKPWMSVLLLWLVTASSLLMLGFLIDSDAMSPAGLARVLTSSLLGSLCGLSIKRSANRRTKKRGGMKTRSKLT